jgi:hypothetical protein
MRDLMAESLHTHSFIIAVVIIDVIHAIERCKLGCKGSSVCASRACAARLIAWPATCLTGCLTTCRAEGTRMAEATLITAAARCACPIICNT